MPDSRGSSYAESSTVDNLGWRTGSAARLSPQRGVVWVGVDISRERLRRARGVLRAIQASGLALPFPSETFHAVLAVLGLAIAFFLYRLATYGHRFAELRKAPALVKEVPAEPVSKARNPPSP